MNQSKRNKVYRKYNGHCGYCGKKLSFGDMTIDHIVAVSRGGGNGIENLMPSCRECNEAKAADNLEMLRIHFVWSSLKISDIRNFKLVRLAASKYKFYFEEYGEKLIPQRMALRK